MANVFDRISNMIRANVNDLLDSAEDPEKMLNQIIRDMNDALRQADSDIADQIAQQKMIAGDLDEAKRNQAAWESKAELAVRKERDDLAREALVRANDYAEQVAIYEKQLDAQQQVVNELKTKRDQLKAKYDRARSNKESLVARARAAQARSNISGAARKVEIADYSSELERMERRIREQEARAEADEEVAASKTSIDDEFAKLGDDGQVEAQLAALKAKLAK